MNKNNIKIDSVFINQIINANIAYAKLNEDIYESDLIDSFENFFISKS